MARIRLNLRNLSVTEKIAKGRHIVTAMTDNAAFSTPNPSLTDVTASLDELARTSAGVQAAKSEVATRTVAQNNAETKSIKFSHNLPVTSKASPEKTTG